MWRLNVLVVGRGKWCGVNLVESWGQNTPVRNVVLLGHEKLGTTFLSKNFQMKTIGLLGGMSWESTLEYYRIINEKVNEKLGRLHSAKILMYSFDFEEIEELQRREKWKEAAKLMVKAAKKVENGGADLILICTNTMHKVADEVQSNIKIPLLHIADVTAEKIKSKGLKKVGLLGTKFTMEENFYKDRLTERYNFEVVIPDEEERRVVNDIIFKELCLGKRKATSKEKLKMIMNNLISKRGCEGIILGCTELPLLIKQEDFDVPIFDTTKIHALAAVDLALS